MKKKVTAFNLSVDLLQEIDNIRGEIPRSRIVEKMLFNAIKTIEVKNGTIY